MDFRASGVRSLKLNIFLILKEVKTNLILRSASQKRLSNCRSLSSAILEFEFRYSAILFSTRIKEHTVSDKNSHIFKHFSQFPSCKGMYTPSCFRILDSANSSIDLKLKEAFYISKNKPDLNKQLHHFNTFLTL